MKKLLISALSFTMGVTCAFGLAACKPNNSGNNGGNNNGPTDAEAAQAAITSVRTMYLDKSADTPVDYQVAGKVLVSGTAYTVDWSVSEEVAELIKVGEIDANNQITISVDRVEAEVEYTLTASVTVGEATEKTSFSRVIPVVYKASDMPELAKDLAEDEYYKVDNKEKKIYVEGYVVDTGSWGAQYSNFTNVYVADTAEGTKDNGFLVYRLGTDTTFIKSKYDLLTGSEIVVGGYLTNYKGTSSKATLELTYPSNNTNDNPTAVYYKKVEMTDTDLLNWMLADEVEDTIIVNKISDIILATSPVADVNFSWAIKSGNAATLNNGVLSVTSLPTPEQGDATVVLTVTATRGSTTITKDVTVTLKATVPGSITSSVNIKTYAEDHQWDHASTKYQTVNIDDNVTATTEEGGNNNGKYYSTGIGSWRLYKSENATLTISVAAGYKLLSVTITYASGAFEGVTSGLANEASGRSVSYTVTENVQINAIEVVYVALGADEHEHVWGYDYNAGTWTHTKTCTVSGCDLEGEAATVVEDCEPVLNVCPNCHHEYSEDDVLTALFALESGKSLKGTYKLTGVVTEIEEAYSTQYKNVTFNFQVGDKIVKAYRLSGTYADTVKVGDTVTVTGVLKNYDGTKEFDSNCKIATLVPGADTRSDAEKVQAALADVPATITVTTAGDTDLPAPSVEGVEFAWTIEEGEAATIVGGKLHVENLPVANATVILKVTATCGNVTTDNTKTVTVTIMSADINYGTINEPLTVAEALALAQLQCVASNDVTKQVVYMKGVLTNVPTDKTTYYQNLYLADAGALGTTILVYTVNLRSNVAAPDMNDILVICGYIKNYNGTIEFASNSGTNVYIESNTRGTSTITLGAHAGATVNDLPNTAKNGDQVTFTVTADGGKEIDSVKVNGTVLVEDSGSYKFTVAGNMTVTVETKDAGAKSAEVLYNLEQVSSTANNNYAGNSNITCGDITWNVNGNGSMNPWRFGGKSITNEARTLKAKNAISGKVTKVVLALGGSTNILNSITLNVYNSDPTVAGASAIYTSGPVAYSAEITFTPGADENWSNSYFEIVFNVTVTSSSNTFVTISKLEFWGFEADSASVATASVEALPAEYNNGKEY